MKICRAEFDRLIEQSPSIDDKIIILFDGKFKDNDIIRPEICNGLKKCRIYKPSHEEKLSNILAEAGNKLLAKKDLLKTVKTWKRLEVKQEKTDMKPPTTLKMNITDDAEPDKPSLLDIDETNDYKEVKKNLEAFINGIEDIETGDPKTNP